MAEIPTMECPRCGGEGYRRSDIVQHWARDVDCITCRESGRIPRPPLTPDEIAALPDGARVIIEDTHPRCLRRGCIGDSADRDAALRLVRAGCRIWLAEEAE